MTSASAVPAFLLLGLWLVATHLKVQWYVGAILLLPVLVFETSTGQPRLEARRSHLPRQHCWCR